jgi:hypothetical protein
MLTGDFAHLSSGMFLRIAPIEMAGVINSMDINPASYLFGQSARGFGIELI